MSIDRDFGIEYKDKWAAEPGQFDAVPLRPAPCHEIVIDPDIYETMRKIDVDSHGLVEISIQHMDGGWDHHKYLSDGQKLCKVQ